MFHDRSLLSMLFKITSNQVHRLSGALRLPSAARVARGVRFKMGTRLSLLAVELISIALPLCPYQHLYGTIFMTLCLMMRELRGLRAEPMLFCWSNLLLIFVFLSFFFNFFSIAWLVVALGSH